jgi:hypothetical protein
MVELVMEESFVDAFPNRAIASKYRQRELKHLVYRYELSEITF